MASARSRAKTTATSAASSSERHAGHAASRLRCAVYTRKSTEDGLEQEFNSLDAQREACEAYVLSQASLGWKLVPSPYDDGGISGGTMERPALQRLLRDIRSGLVEVVVVYKIDRLTRSLADFAKMVEVFDAANASFVSVTQQFNTTTSMGRLTLNVLLSFAQFEREVTAERIRDKIAASRAKGIFMGGSVPLGYRTIDRRLQVDEAEAQIVRHLFQRYLELQSLDLLAAEANAMKVPSRKLDAHGDPIPRVFARGQLSYLLANPVYIGKVRHRDQLHDGEHQPIIDKTMFDEVQGMLAGRAARRSAKTNNPDLHLLTGLVFDDQGNRLLAVHSSRQGKRYRYYATYRGRAPDGDAGTKTSNEGRSSRTMARADLHFQRKQTGRGAIKQGWRLAVRELERPVEAELLKLLADGRRLSDLAQNPAALIELDGTASATIDIVSLMKRGADLAKVYRAAPIHEKRSIIKSMVARIELGDGQMTIMIDRAGLLRALRIKPGQASCDGTDTGSQKSLAITLPMTLRRRGVETCLVIGGEADQRRAPDANLMALLQRAASYRAHLLDAPAHSGIGDLAEANGVDRSDFTRVLKLAFLAPDIVESIVNGSQSVELTMHTLTRLADLPLSWSEQRNLLSA